MFQMFPEEKSDYGSVILRKGVMSRDFDASVLKFDLH